MPSSKFKKAFKKADIKSLKYPFYFVMREDFLNFKKGQVIANPQKIKQLIEIGIERGEDIIYKVTTYFRRT